jgi:hypothetical protein
MLHRFKSTHVLEIIAILVLCSVVYLANGVTITSGDTVPNTLLAFNLLENHTLHFDNLRQATIPSAVAPYFFIESQRGHLTSLYPIGVAIVTFPLYLLFYLYLKLAHIPVNLMDGSFDSYRLWFEKLAAVTIAALSVALFYTASRSRFSRGISFSTTGIFAFATNTWVTSSQGLWQHGASSLMLLSAVVCLLKANVIPRQHGVMWLGMAGLATGLLPAIRPTSGLLAIALLIYVFATHRNCSIPFLLGLCSAIPGLAWNLYYFGNISGGYSGLLGDIYRFTPSQLIESFIGLLISPSRGLLIFSPILLFGIPGLVNLIKLRHQRDIQLWICLAMGCLGIFTAYCFYTIWWGGHCYGPRYMTDFLPVMCYVLNFPLMQGARLNYPWWDEVPHCSLLLSVVLVFSLWVQVVGAFGLAAGTAGRSEATPNFWNEVPIDLNQQKLWDWQDNQIRRHTISVIHRLIRPPVTSPSYRQGLQGSILSIKNATGMEIPKQFTCIAGNVSVLKATVKNTGSSPWFGYLSALEKGEARINFSYSVANGQVLATGQLYIADRVLSGQVAEAIGLFLCPYDPGVYSLSFELTSEHIGNIHFDQPSAQQRLRYQLAAIPQ